MEKDDPGGEHFAEVQKGAEVASYTLEDDGTFPNNATLPLVVYRGAFYLPDTDPAAVIEMVFSAHQWGRSWRNGIFRFHHYHSTAHEVLGVYRGSARVQFGGENGVVITASHGDVLILPAGVAHKNLRASRDFGVVGSYPKGQDFDMNYGQPGERPQADDNIARVPLPVEDPVYGPEGPLGQYWPLTR